LAVAGAPAVTQVAVVVPCIAQRRALRLISNTVREAAYDHCMPLSASRTALPLVSSARLVESDAESARPLDRQSSQESSDWSIPDWRHALDLILAAFAGVVYVAGCFYARGFDEFDNLLGGKLIAGGQLPYGDFFSHHMPGMYLLAAVLYPFTGENIFLFRLGFNLLLLSVLLVNAALLRRLVGASSARLYLVVLPLAHLVGFGQMALAEPFVAAIFATCLIIILFTEPHRLFDLRTLGLLSALLFLVPFFSLSYIFVTAILYVILAVRYYKARRPWTVRGVGTALATLGVPYVITFVAMLATDTLRPFLFDVITFNATYYAPLVGQSGGSVARTLLEAVKNSTDQLVTLASHVGDSAYTVQLLHVLAYFLLGVVLWREKRRTEGLAFLSLLFLINPLINIFNPPGMVSPLAERTQHSIMFTTVALTAACIAIPRIWQQARTRRRAGRVAIRTAAVVYFVVVSVSLGSFTSDRLSAVFVRHEAMSVHAIAKTLPEDVEAAVVNELTSSNDYAWIGPANFNSQLYMEAKRASIYTFFIQWQNECAKCRQELLDGFASQQPVVVVWRNTSTWTPHAEIRQFLDREYFQVGDPRLAEFFFLERDRVSLTQKLAELGYHL
jgi:hypothetical protein